MANQTVYPYGTGGSLPSSIGIINDAYTGGSNKALSAEVGKSLNAKIDLRSVITLSALTDNNGFITNENKWTTATGYKCKFLRVAPGERYLVQANLTTYSSISVLTSAEITNNDAAPYATGWGKVNLSVGTYYELSIPSDGKYLYMASFNAIDSVVPNALARLNGPVHVDAMQYSVPLGVPVLAYPKPNGTWTAKKSAYDYWGIFVPIEGGKRITVYSHYYVHYTFLKSADYEHGAEVDYATGYSGAPVNSGTTTATLISPADAKYLYLVCSFDGFVANNITPYDVKTFASKVEDIAKAVVSGDSGTESGIPSGLAKYTYEGKAVRVKETHKVAYEEISNAITSVACQGGACYGDYLFMFTENNTTCWIFNLATKTLLQTYTIPSAERGFVSNCHSNTVNFGTEKYDSSDPFPLIYVSTGYASDGYSGVLVYRIVATTENDVTTYSLTLVQTVKIPAAWSEFVVGEDGDCFVKGVDSYFYRMAMPKLSQGDITLDFSNALQVCKVTDPPSWYNGSRAQGHLYHNGKMYLVSGVPTSEASLFIAIDIATGIREVEIDLYNTLGLHSEPEALFIWNGHFCIVFRNNANVYTLYFE